MVTVLVSFWGLRETKMRVSHSSEAHHRSSVAGAHWLGIFSFNDRPCAICSLDKDNQLITEMDSETVTILLVGDEKCGKTSFLSCVLPPESGGARHPLITVHILGA